MSKPDKPPLKDIYDQLVKGNFNVFWVPNTSFTPLLGVQTTVESERAEFVNKIKLLVQAPVYRPEAAEVEIRRVNDEGFELAVRGKIPLPVYQHLLTVDAKLMNSPDTYVPRHARKDAESQMAAQPADFAPHQHS